MNNQPSDWLPFPDPRAGGILHAPYGPGVYQIRNRQTGQLILFGSSKRLAWRMCSLLPEPLGCGGRDNNDKRNYVLEHLADLDYRCWTCESEDAAKSKERELKRAETYLFTT